MDVWKHIVGNDSIILGMVFIIVLFFLVKVIIKIRNIKLLMTVTSLNRGTKSERDLVLNLLKNGISSKSIFHDLCIEKNHGVFSQIDVVVATTEGIIVFEVKDYSGWIFGNGNYSHWTKVLAYGKKKYRFYNPIKQNKSHILALQKQHKAFNNIPFFSIIAFYGDCELKEINFVPESTFLVKSHRIFEVITFIKENNGLAQYTNKQEIVSVLKNAVSKGANKSNQERHIENINNMLGKDRIYE